MKLKDIAQYINAELFGDGEIEIKGVSGLDSVREGEITFIKSKKYLKKLTQSAASAVITNEAFDDLNIPQLILKNPLIGFAKVLEIFYPEKKGPIGISEGAHVCSTARIGKDVTIYPHVFIGENTTVGDRTIIYPGVFIGEDVKIGSDCVIFPNVSIYNSVVIGSRVRIHAGTVIGSDGFGYVFEADRHYKIPQVGGVIVEDDVEIGASVTIDRATTGNTVIGEGTKIDNLVQIAHNVHIGKHCIIVAQVGIAGSTRLGNYVTLAGQVGVSDHTTIEDGTIVTAQSGVMGDVKKGVYSGSPAMSHFKWLRVRATLELLPDIHKKVKELEKAIKEIKGGQDNDRD
jgi:UDP-3-O-[3-hydroxymyristoyl] glucosamine N-acyltransferase